MNRAERLSKLVDALLEVNQRLYAIRNTPEWHSEQEFRLKQDAISILATHLEELRAVTEKPSTNSLEPVQ